MSLFPFKSTFFACIFFTPFCMPDLHGYNRSNFDGLYLDEKEEEEEEENDEHEEEEAKSSEADIDKNQIKWGKWTLVTLMVAGLIYKIYRMRILYNKLYRIYMDEYDQKKDLKEAIKKEYNKKVATAPGSQFASPGFADPDQYFQTLELGVHIGKMEDNTQTIIMPDLQTMAAMINMQCFLTFTSPDLRKKRLIHKLAREFPFNAQGEAKYVEYLNNLTNQFNDYLSSGRSNTEFDLQFRDLIDPVLTSRVSTSTIPTISTPTLSTPTLSTDTKSERKSEFFSHYHALDIRVQVACNDDPNRLIAKATI